MAAQPFLPSPSSYLPPYSLSLSLSLCLPVPSRVIEFKTGPKRPSPIERISFSLSLPRYNEREERADRHGGDGDGEEMESDLFILLSLPARVYKSRTKMSGVTRGFKDSFKDVNN